MFVRNFYVLVFAPALIIIAFLFGFEPFLILCSLIAYVNYGHTQEWSVWGFAWRSTVIMEVLYFGTIYGEYYFRLWLT